MRTNSQQVFQPSRFRGRAPLDAQSLPAIISIFTANLSGKQS